MFVDYYFYLIRLTQEERNRQILTIILIFGAMLLIAGIIEIIKYKSKKKM